MHALNIVVRRAARVATLGSVVAAVAGATWGTYLAYTRPWLCRIVRFWWHMGPIILHYRWVGRTVTNPKDPKMKALHRRYAPSVRRILGELRGVFTKVAQVLSITPDTLPPEYADEFRTLFDMAPTASWAVIRAVLEEDLGAPVTQIFDEIDEEPLGAASIGQAHLVTWQGRRAVVKVQYPAAADRMRADFDCIETLMGMVNKEGLVVMQRIRRQFELELDYAQEAKHLQWLHESLAVAPEFSHRVVVPRPIMELTRGRVLGMDFCPGRKLAEVLTERLQALGVSLEDRSIAAVLGRPQSLSKNQEGDAGDIARGSSLPEPKKMPSHVGGNMPLAFRLAATVVGPAKAWQLLGEAAEVGLQCRRRWHRARGKSPSAAPLQIPAGGSAYELRSALRLVLQVHGYQIFFSPVFNGDPHPGNILALPDGRLGLIDFGQCVQFRPSAKASFARLILALCSPPSAEIDDQIATHIMSMGVKSANSSREYLSFLCRWCLTGFCPAWFVDDYAKKRLAIDSVVEQPIEVVMIGRMSSLLRGFGFLVLENVSIAQAWQPYAERWLREHPEL